MCRVLREAPEGSTEAARLGGAKVPTASSPWEKWKPTPHCQLLSPALPSHTESRVYVELLWSWLSSTRVHFTETFTSETLIHLTGTKKNLANDQLSCSYSKTLNTGTFFLWRSGQVCLFKRLLAIRLTNIQSVYNKLVVTEWLIQPRPVPLLTAWRSWKVTWKPKKGLSSQQK